MITIIKENWPALRFMIVFVMLYVGMNTLYGLYYEAYLPTSDPLTKSIALQVVGLLKIFDNSMASYPSASVEFINIANDRENVISIFEGCNGVNVMIVYVSFLVAFKGPRIEMIKFMGMGAVSIHLLNLARIVLLYAIAFHFPEHLYFFHKYLFTGIIYVIVFVLWFFWVSTVRNANSTK